MRLRTVASSGSSARSFPPTENQGVVRSDVLPDEVVLRQQGAGSVVEAGGLDGVVEAEEVGLTAPCGFAVEPVADVLLLHGWEEHPLVAIAGGSRVAEPELVVEAAVARQEYGRAAAAAQLVMHR